MLNEFARMSRDDGLVMQLHLGSLRDHNGPLARVRARHRRRYPGRDRLDARAAAVARGVRQRPGFAVILYTLDESTYGASSRRSRGHYPAVLLGCPWWFHDSPAGIDRYLDRVVETAGVYNLAGFVDDARALTALPARHDLWRRRTCGWLAGESSRLPGREEANRIAWELAYGLARRTYRI